MPFGRAKTNLSPATQGRRGSLIRSHTGVVLLLCRGCPHISPTAASLFVLCCPAALLHLYLPHFSFNYAHIQPLFFFFLHTTKAALLHIWTVHFIDTSLIFLRLLLHHKGEQAARLITVCSEIRRLLLQINSSLGSDMQTNRCFISQSRRTEQDLSSANNNTTKQTKKEARVKRDIRVIEWKEAEDADEDITVSNS